MDELGRFVAPQQTIIGGLLLRPWGPGDGAAMAAAVNASYEHLAPWMAWASPDDDPRDAEVRARLFGGKYLANDDFVLSVWDGDEVIAGTGFHPRWGGMSSRVAEIGMWVAHDRAHTGVGTMLLQGLVQWGLSDAWCWDRLLWLCDGDNVASARVAQKVGFTLEGNLRGPGPDGAGRDSTLVWGFNRSDLDRHLDGPAEPDHG